MTNATGGQDHARPAVEAPLLAIDGKGGSPHLAAFDGQFPQAPAEVNVDAGALQAVEQAGDQRIAHHQARAAGIADAVDKVAGHQPGTGNERGPGLPAPHQCLDVGLAHHHPAEQQELRHRRPDPRECATQQPSVEGARRQRPASDRRTGQSQVVRMLSRTDEGDVGALLEVGNGRVAGFQERLPQLAPIVRPDQRVQVAGRRLDRVCMARLRPVPVARDPERAGGSGRRASDLL